MLKMTFNRKIIFDDFLYTRRNPTNTLKIINIDATEISCRLARECVTGDDKTKLYAYMYIYII